MILSPKTDFMGGGLISASHLGRIFPEEKLFTWKKKSKFLTLNGVKHEECVGFMDRDKPLWVNDICVDGGYYMEYLDQNRELFQYISHWDKVILVNHQPINRVKNYLLEVLPILNSVKDITILNYRAGWNIEWDNLLKIRFPRIKVATLPYFYYLGFIEKTVPDYKDAVVIGRTNSKCKIGSRYDYIKENSSISVDRLEPDDDLSNSKFIEELSKYRFVLTGYYYGGEGSPELDVPHNHLEWSYMDALLAGCIPITSSLFQEELTRLGMNQPTFYYDMDSIPPDLEYIKDNHPLVQDDNLRVKWTANLVKEIEFGIEIIRALLYGYNG